VKNFAKVLVYLLVILVTDTYAQNDIEKRIQKNSSKSEVIVLAEVKCVDLSPGGWSGIIPTVQRIQYKVREVLKGDLDAEEISVGHYKVKNSKLTDKKYPKLSEDFFSEGREVILFLALDVGKDYFENPKKNCGCGSEFSKFIAFDADYGAVLAEKDVLEIIRQTIPPK
jgi:hypothetical protein